ncbi:hypothetical protein B0H13DRAFT_1859405 [Mycena leptocephala]|nr:hypothetical protein B0H13DRAFT_1859405 [Mycena leptocephala]
MRSCGKQTRREDYEGKTTRIAYYCACSITVSIGAQWRCRDWQANAREVRRLRAVIQATHTTLAPIMALSERTTANVEWLNLELRTAENDLRELESSVVGECLKNFNDLKTLETALNIRVAAMKELTAALDRHPVENPLVKVLQPHAAAYVQALEGLQTSLTYANTFTKPTKTSCWFLKGFLFVFLYYTLPKNDRVKQLADDPDPQACGHGADGDGSGAGSHDE